MIQTLYSAPLIALSPRSGPLFFVRHMHQNQIFNLYICVSVMFLNLIIESSLVVAQESLQQVNACIFCFFKLFFSIRELLPLLGNYQFKLLNLLLVTFLQIVTFECQFFFKLFVLWYFLLAHARLLFNFIILLQQLV